MKALLLAIALATMSFCGLVACDDKVSDPTQQTG